MSISDLEILYESLGQMHLDRTGNSPIEVDDSLFLAAKEVLFSVLNIREDKPNNNLLHALLECESSFEEFLEVFGRHEVFISASAA
ncbi:MAG: hypothetical protein KDD35_01615 [Bdellovibrionales bacterium]|nr:hypothetical protein [Bdellovibrionales bacterium]